MEYSDKTLSRPRRLRWLLNLMGNGVLNVTYKFENKRDNLTGLAYGECTSATCAVVLPTGTVSFTEPINQFPSEELASNVVLLLDW